VPAVGCFVRGFPAAIRYSSRRFQKSVFVKERSHNSHLESELQGFRQESGLWRVGEQQRIEEFFRSMVIEAADLKQSSNAFVMKLERNLEENLVASLSREFS
jgi:hypothetical protein